MANLHAIASAAISVINQNVTVTLRRSSGYTISDDGKQVPTYAADVAVQAQVQDLTQKDIDHLEGQNIQGSQRVIYLSGNVDAISRISRKGGDLIIMADRTVWLTTAVLESWPDWCKVSVTQQDSMDSVDPAYDDDYAAWVAAA